MTMTMELSVLFIVICALGSCKTPAIPVDIRVAPYPLIVGQPSYIQLHLSRDPKVDQRDLHVWKRPNGTSEDEGKVPGKGDFICEGMYKSQTKDLDFHFPKGYTGIWNSDKLILTIFIEEVGPQHEGAYVAEYGVTEFPFHQKVLAAPPSTQAPNTSTEGVKDSCAVDERFFTMHQEDRNAWIQLTQNLIAVMIVTVIASLLSLCFFGYLYFRKMSAAFKTKTGEEKTSPLHSGGQDQTPGNASRTPFGYFNVQGRGNSYRRPGGRAGSGTGGIQPDPENDDLIIDMGNRDMAQSSVQRGETTRRGGTQRTRTY